MKSAVVPMCNNNDNKSSLLYNNLHAKKKTRKGKQYINVKVIYILHLTLKYFFPHSFRRSEFNVNF